MHTSVPPEIALNEFLGATTRHIRRVEIYEQDGTTRWTKDTIDRLITGSVSVDYDRDERRSLDLTLSNTDGVLINAPGEFWYDKIIKVFRGVQVNEPVRVPKVLILSDKTGEEELAASFRDVLVANGFGDVQINLMASDYTFDIEPFDIIVALTQATATQRAILVDAYRAGKSVFVQDNATGSWITSLFPTAVKSLPAQEHTVHNPFGSSPRTNFFPNPSLETVATGWSGGYGTSGTGTRARTASATAKRGGYVYRQTWTGPSTSTTGIGPYGQTLSNLPLGGTVSIRVSARSNRLGNPLTLRVRALAASTVTQTWTDVTLDQNENNPDGWIDFEVNGFELPANGNGVRLQVWNQGVTPIAGDIIEMDAVLVEVADEVGTYFDGSLVPPLTTWTGTTHNSASNYVPGFATSDGTGTPSTVAPRSNAPHPVAKGWSRFPLTGTGNIAAYEISDPEHTLIAPVEDGGQVSRISAFSDPISGGRAIALFALVNYQQYDAPQFQRMLVSAFSWLNTVEPLTTWEVQIGEFMIDRITEPHFPHNMKITGRDYTKKCMTSKFAYATQFVEGLALESIIAAIAGAAGIQKRLLPPTGITVGQTFFYERGTSRWTAMKEIATAYNYELFFDPQGYLVMRPFQDPATTPPSVYIHTGQEGQIASYEKSTADSRLFNHIIVVGENSDSDIPLASAEVKNEDPNSYTSIDEIGDRLYEYVSAFITSDAQALEVANSFLAVYSLEEFELSFDSLVLPWLDVGDILGWIDPNPSPGDPTTFLLSNLTIPLELAPMSGSAKRVIIV